MTFNLVFTAIVLAAVVGAFGIYRYGQAQHKKGWTEAANAVATDIHAFTLHQLGRTDALSTAMAVCDALNEAKALAVYHATNYQALPAAYAQTTSPVGEGRHRSQDVRTLTG